MNHVGTQIINTPRLCLRPFCLNDNSAMLKNWISDPLVQLQYAEPVYETKQQVQKLLKTWIKYYKLPHFYRWTITEKGKDESIGQIAFYSVDLQNHWCEIEYCLSRQFQNQGYITEALQAVVNFGFHTIGFNRIQISHRRKNIASQRVIEKIGFEYEGVWRQAVCFENEYDDRLYYSLLKSSYLNQQR